MSLAFCAAWKSTVREGIDDKSRAQVVQLSSIAKPPITNPLPTLTLNPAGISGDDIVDELDRGSAFPLRLADELGVAALLLNDWRGG